MDKAADRLSKLIKHQFVKKIKLERFKSDLERIDFHNKLSYHVTQPMTEQEVKNNVLDTKYFICSVIIIEKNSEETTVETTVTFDNMLMENELEIDNAILNTLDAVGINNKDELDKRGVEIRVELQPLSDEVMKNIMKVAEEERRTEKDATELNIESTVVNGGRKTRNRKNKTKRKRNNKLRKSKKHKKQSKRC